LVVVPVEPDELEAPMEPLLPEPLEPALLGELEEPDEPEPLAPMLVEPEPELPAVEEEPPGCELPAVLLPPSRPQAASDIAAATMTARAVPRERWEAFIWNSLVGGVRGQRNGSPRCLLTTLGLPSRVAVVCHCRTL
jgi:hypothetical protein